MSKRKKPQSTPPKGSAGVHPMVQMFDAVQKAESLRLSGKLDEARTVCGKALKQDRQYVAALFTMGLILADQSDYERSLGYLHRAAMHNPHDPKILTGLSGIYLRMGANMMASRTLEQARRITPEDPNILITLGEIYRDEKEYELSKEAFEAALKVEPDRDVAQMGLARNLNEIGELDGARRLFEGRLEDGSRSLACLYHLSQLPTSLVTVDVLALLDEAKPAEKQSMDDFRSQRSFARAAALDKAGRYDEAWTEVCKARRYNSGENRRTYKQASERHEPLLEMAKTLEVKPKVVERSEGDGEIPISLFIVGPSRSGKTTLERLAGLLPGVKRGYENPIVENAVRRSFQTAGFPTRSLLVHLPAGMSDMFNEYYGEELAKRAGSARVLTNTLPQRTEDAVRVANEIPNARFVFVKRNIDDIALRIFMRNYARGNYYASDLGDIREHLEWSHALMDIAAERMPEIARVVTYEDMVSDPRRALEQVADLCGLRLDDREVPQIGDDRNCAAPYLSLMETLIQ